MKRTFLFLLVALLPLLALPQDIITRPTKKPTQTTTPAQKPPKKRNVINGHEYVDLGLSVTWATTNVGASSPSDYGDYFAWGETSTKSEYTEANSRTYKTSMDDIAGNAAYDAARANWGGTWRLPTKAECKELVNQCTWTWTTQGGHNGYRVTGKNGNSIFLPATRFYHGLSLDIGGYWSSTPYKYGTECAYDLYFTSSEHLVNWYNRYDGSSVRPVSELKPVEPKPEPAPVKPTRGTISGHEWVDLGLSVKWATTNVGASSPSDYGYYFAWGETSTKSEYTEANSRTYKTIMGDIAGNTAYDAARANWGGTWRLPTEAEYEELVDQCTWTWTTQGGHNGYRVTGKNGNSIFLPAAGDRCGSSLDSVGEHGIYWSSTPLKKSTAYAYGLHFHSSYRYVNWTTPNTRDYGRSVRPVTE